jgi:hypothetical protein
MSGHNLKYLLAPQAVAVIGGSDRAGSVGATVMRNLLAGGFRGPVWPVNPAHATVAGGRAWASTGDLPAAPDLAVCWRTTLPCCTWRNRSAFASGSACRTLCKSRSICRTHSPPTERVEIGAARMPTRLWRAAPQRQRALRHAGNDRSTSRCCAVKAVRPESRQFARAPCAPGHRRRAAAAGAAPR